MFKILFNSLILLVSIQAESLTGNRVLFLQDKAINPSDYSIFFNDLKDRGYDVEYKKASDSDLALIEYAERKYDHVILFSPKTKSFGNGVHINDFVEFVNQGGNILMAASSTISQTYKELGSQFHVTFDNKLTSVIDPFHHHQSEDSKSSPIYSSQYTSLTHVVPDQISGATLFNGIAHKVQSNPMVFPILSAEWTALSAESDTTSSNSPLLYGNDIQLISGFQALNNARVIVCGSINLFSDEYFNTSIQPTDSEDQKVKSKSSNRLLAQEITKWAFQEKSVLRIDSARHALKKTDKQLDWYRINDNVTYQIQLSQYNEGKWTGHKADQIQLEIVMLDPYIRTDLLPVSAKETKSSEYFADLQLPDRYGVFTFKVDYKRPGWSYLTQSDVVPIRPLRHNEYPRFLTAAYPYYTGAASMSFGFLIFCFVWLYNKDPANTQPKLKTN